MNPNTVPWLVCSIVCIWPVLLGVLTFIALRILAKRFPVFHLWREKTGDGQTHIFAELYLTTHAEARAEKQAQVDDSKDNKDII
jgi:hypothetical protein